MAKFEISRPTTNANSIGTPRPALAAPPTAAISRTCVPVSAPIAVDHADAERRARPVGAHLERLDVLVAVHAGLETPPCVADAVEDEHPPAPEPERVTGPGVAVDGVEDPGAEAEEGDADDATHDRVEPVGQERAERERGDPEGDDDGAVTEGVQRAQPDRLELVGRQERSACARRGHRRQRRRARVPRRGRGPRSGHRDRGGRRRSADAAPGGSPPRRRQRPRCS